MEVNHFLFAALVVFLSAAALCRGGYVILDSEEVLKRLKDFSFECTPEDFAEQSQKDIFTVEDCNKKGARADYDYKVLGKGKKNDPTFNGKAVISFPSDSATQSLPGSAKFALRHKKCLRLGIDPKDRIESIQGTFVDDRLQGRVTVKFFNDTNLVGYAVDNRLAGMAGVYTMAGRSFAINSVKKGNPLEEKLIRIIDAKSQMLWDVLPSGAYRWTGKNAIVTWDFETFFSCGTNLDGQYMEDCVKDTGIKAALEHCLLVPKRTKPVQIDAEKFMINLSSEKFFHDPTVWTDVCKEGKEIEDIRKSFESWTAVTDYFWITPSFEDPLEEYDPKVWIKFPQFVDHVPAGISGGPITIESSSHILFQGRMVNGIVKGAVDPKLANLSDWRAPLSLYITPLDTKQKILLARFRLKKGKMQGPVKMFGRVANDPTSSCNNAFMTGVSFAGNYDKGIPVGHCWKGLIGGSWIHGVVDCEGKFTGEDIAFVYPDLKTALVGKFEDGLMIEAQEAEVNGAMCKDGIMKLECTPPSGPFYHYDPPTKESLGDQPLLGDPLDNRYVYVAPSELGEGEGLFAKTDIPPHTAVALMSGFPYTNEEMDQLKNEQHAAFTEKGVNPWDPEALGASMYRYGKRACNQTVDLPEEYGCTTRFRAALGHKVNFSFSPNAVLVETMDTARFGIISGLRSGDRPIARGEELSADYGYSMDNELPWFKELVKKFREKDPERAAARAKRKTP